jgi:GTP cyclohydrolase IA
VSLDLDGNGTTTLVLPETLGQGEVDVVGAEVAVGNLLESLGFKWTDDEHLRDTPRRVAASFLEQLRQEPVTLTTFPNEGYDELVVAKDIEFHSLCAHHLLPFTGVAHVGYLPDGKILGLSKLARVVDLFAHRLQLQERMTTQIATWLEGNLEPKGVGVVVEAEHTCMSVRGVRKPGSRTVTSALLGTIRDDARTRQEFLSLIGAG